MSISDLLLCSASLIHNVAAASIVVVLYSVTSSEHERIWTCMFSYSGVSFIFFGGDGDDDEGENEIFTEIQGEKQLKKINQMLGGERFPLVYESAFALRIHVLLLMVANAIAKADAAFRSHRR